MIFDVLIIINFFYKTNKKLKSYKYPLHILLGIKIDIQYNIIKMVILKSEICYKKHIYIFLFGSILISFLNFQIFCIKICLVI